MPTVSKVHRLSTGAWKSRPPLLTLYTNLDRSQVLQALNSTLAKTITMKTLELPIAAEFKKDDKWKWDPRSGLLVRIPQDSGLC